MALELAIQTHPATRQRMRTWATSCQTGQPAYDRALQLDKGNGTVATKLNLVRDLFSTNPKQTLHRARCHRCRAAVDDNRPPAVIANGVQAAAAALRRRRSDQGSLQRHCHRCRCTGTSTCWVTAGSVALLNGSPSAMPVLASEQVGQRLGGHQSGRLPRPRIPEFQTGGRQHACGPCAARRERITTPPRKIKVELLGTTVEAVSATGGAGDVPPGLFVDTLQTRSRKTLTPLALAQRQRWLTIPRCVSHLRSGARGLSAQQPRFISAVPW